MQPELITALGTLVGAVGGILATWAVARKTAREDTQALIDQLQEERTAFVEQLEKERAGMREDRVSYESKIDALWTDKAASRQYVGALTDHIWQRKDPPPPEPPAGYIH